MTALRSILVSTTLAGGCLSLGFWLGGYVTFDTQKAMGASLVGVSSIIFGVLGIWVGVMSPGAVQAIYTGDSHIERERHWHELRHLLVPIFISLAVLSSTTIFTFVGELLKVAGFDVTVKHVFRQIGLSFLMAAMMATIYLLAVSARPGLEMLVKTYGFMRRKKRIETVFDQPQQPSIPLKNTPNGKS
jgi:hypothetical protein